MKKSKKPRISTLKKKADTLYSQWLRQSNADHAGMVQCYTCPQSYHWKAMQCGHFVSRTHTSTRWYEKNTKPQCMSCNVWRRGNSDVYALNLVKEYGVGILKELNDLKNTTVKMKAQDYLDLITDLTNKLKEHGTLL